MEPAFLPIALIAYLVGVLLAGLTTLFQSHSARSGASITFVAAWLAHLAAVVHRGVTLDRLPLANMGEYLLVLGLAVMSLHLLIWFRFKIHVAGLVLVPLAGASTFAAMVLLRDPAAAESPVSSPLFLAHTTVSTLGMATLLVALTMSLIYVFQDRALKARSTLDLLDRLPPLDRCDRLGWNALVIGFGLFTVGIATGLAFNQSVYGKLWVPGLKQSFPILAWTIFAVVLMARWKLGVRGRKSAYWTITGGSLGLLTILGMTI
jgi:ABC-type uncharacterized transport system permease subunit